MVAVKQFRYALKGGVGGQARAGVGGREFRIGGARVKEVAAMGYDHVIPKAPGLLDSKIFRSQAELLIAAAAGGAGAAANPRIGHAQIPEGRSLGVRAQGDDFADDLVAESHALPGHGQGLAAPKVENPIVQVHIGMADAAGDGAQEDFRALRFRRGPFNPGQGGSGAGGLQLLHGGLRL